MYEAKTKATATPVTTYLEGMTDPQRRADCETLIALLERLTGCPATLWGTSIVGFDRYTYRYASGQRGESCIVGFSSRKAALTLYLRGDDLLSATLASLGPVKHGKGCLYFQRLADLDLPALEALLTQSIAATRAQYPPFG